MVACERLALEDVDTPAYVIDLLALRKNLEILARVRDSADCQILLALKGFAAWCLFPMVGEYLDGVAASSPDEARLGRQEMGKHVHAYAPAFDETSLREVITYSDHVVFNSVSQVQRFAHVIEEHAGKVRFGLRINPEHSEVDVALYDPCAPGSRLGVTAEALTDASLSGIDGLHFHTLCELGADALARTLPVVEEKFGPWLKKVKWVNFGGGHHITRPDYDLDLLIKLVGDFKERHAVDVFLEPGEAIALHTGVLVTSVLDVIHNDGPIAILDTSATAHMPDVLEMPYRPTVRGAGEPGQYAHTYTLGGLTCLAGDVVGQYSFEEALQVGDRLVFEDMAHYTMVKNTTFNGVRLPLIATFDPTTSDYQVLRRFGYDDYKNRLG